MHQLWYTDTKGVNEFTFKNMYAPHKHNVEEKSDRNLKIDKINA